MKESISQFVNKANYERYLSVRDNIRDIDEIMLESEVVDENNCTDTVLPRY